MRVVFVLGGELVQDTLDRERVVLSVLRDVVRFWCTLSHYMYHGLVTTVITYIVFFFWYIWDDVCFLHLCLTCVVSFLSLYTCLFLYTTCLCFTLDALMNLVYVFHLKQVASLSCHDLSSCKVFQEFVLGLDLCFLNYGIVVLNFSYNCFLWFVTDCQRRRLLGSYFVVIG